MTNQERLTDLLEEFLLTYLPDRRKELWNLLDQETQEELDQLTEGKNFYWETDLKVKVGFYED